MLVSAVVHGVQLLVSFAVQHALFCKTCPQQRSDTSRLTCLQSRSLRSVSSAAGLLLV